MHQRKIPAVMIALAFALIANADEPASAPWSPDFIRYLDRQKQAVLAPDAVDTVENYGLIPLPTEIPQAPVPEGTEQRKTFAARYDLREKGKMSPVRDQGNEGACWSFATYGSMESCSLPSETWDFSENNMVNLAGFDWGFSDGGNISMATAYLVRWNGPVRESDDKYPRPGQSVKMSPVRHTQRVYVFPKRSGYTDNATIKQAIMDYGAVYTVMHSRSGCLKESTGGYYYNGSAACNHAVTIAGWDDNFSRNNFLIPPPGNGAFIVKNSWGTGWGKSGYFYISYYDTRIAEHSAVIPKAESVDNYTYLYQYDPLGQVSWFGNGNRPEAWGANIFTAASAETLRAVSFYTVTPNSKVTIYIYTGCAANSPRSGSLRLTQSATLKHAGYHTLKLNNSVGLASGSRFSVVIKFTASGYNYPVPMECAERGYSSRATARPGQSFYSFNGSTWSDLTGFDASANFCIKAFTGTGAPPPPPPPPPVPQAGAPLLADYDGDGYADPALYWSNGRFRAILSRYGYAQRGVITSYSGTQYQPISGDFDGDGYGDPAVLDRNRAQYRYISSRNGYTGRYFTQKWYWPGLRNGAGDADGDGRADLIGYEPTAPMGTWYVLLSSFNYRTYYWLEWGGVNWVPFCGNVDGDRFGDLIAYDASSRYWYVLLSSTGYTRYVYMRFNVPGKPIVGDIDGDRRADFGTYDPATGIWRILMSSYGYQYYVEATWRGN